MATRRSLEPITLVLPAVLLLLFHGAGNAYCSVVSDNTTDRLSLLDFKKAITDDPNGALCSWNDSIHHCMWSGVSCSKRHPGRVMALDLDGLSLAGQITPSLGNLTFLRELNLSSNCFSGQLPPLHRLRKLEILELDANLLQGNIADALIALTNCSKLYWLDLSTNMLVGSIPQNTDSLSNLIFMRLSRNNLTGGIPATFSNITCLEEIALADNHLQGSIPKELGQLQYMEYVLLGGNRLSGRVPATFFNLSNLRILDLDTNMLSHTLPSDSGDMLPSLEFLFLGANKFEGQIPDSLGNATKLERLDLALNYFTGPIPRYLGKLHKLWHLNLGGNKLEARDKQSWEFLGALSNCPLEILSLHGNELHGVLPNSVLNLSITLERLILGENNLSGTVPPGIGALRNLQILHLGGNNFVGPIPHSIGNLRKLTRLNLSENHFDSW